MLGEGGVVVATRKGSTAERRGWVVKQYSSKATGVGCRCRAWMVAGSKQAVALARSLGGQKSRGGSGGIGCRGCIYRRPNLEDEGSSYEFLCLGFGVLSGSCETAASEAA